MSDIFCNNYSNIYLIVPWTEYSYVIIISLYFTLYKSIAYIAGDTSVASVVYMSYMSYMLDMLDISDMLYMYIYATCCRFDSERRNINDKLATIKFYDADEVKASKLVVSMSVF